MFSLPRSKEGKSYLSYSQIALWIKSKTHRNYIREYFFGEDTSSEGLKAFGDFGSRVGEALENNDFSSFSKPDQKFLATIPRYDEFEKEVWLEMKGFWIKGFIDTNSLDGKKIIDYKTGELDKAAKIYSSSTYIQLDLYSAYLKELFGKLPEDVKVVIIDRKGNSFAREELKLTRKKLVIDRKVDEARVEQVLEDTQAIGEDIALHYKVFNILNV